MFYDISLEKLNNAKNQVSEKLLSFNYINVGINRKKDN